MSGVYSISGGMGGLGLRAASLLVTRGASRVLLSSRSGRVARDGQGLLAQLHELGAGEELVACDSANLLEMAAFRAAHPQVRGYLHAAGAGDRGLLTELEASRERWMLAPPRRRPLCRPRRCPRRLLPRRHRRPLAAAISISAIAPSISATSFASDSTIST